MRRSGIVVMLLLVLTSVSAQDSLRFFEPATCFSSKRFKLLSAGEVIVVGGSLALLNETWYKDYPRSSFHWFNDNAEWLHMDKAAHVFDTYFIGKLGYSGFRWCGMEERKAAIFGGSIGFMYLAGVELLDGLSAQWGASGGDMAANTAGSLLFISQQLIWREQRMALKLSSRPTKFAQYRPETLGATPPERFLKDYNGMTIWMAVNPAMFMRSTSLFPEWIDVAVGYGANGMTGGVSNVSLNSAGGYVPVFKRARQMHLSLDVRLDKLPVRSRLLKTILSAFSFIKLPFPGIIWTEGSGIALDPLGY